MSLLVHVTLATVALGLVGCKSSRSSNPGKAQARAGDNAAAPATPAAIHSVIPPEPKSAVVPRATGPVTIDGQWREQDWVNHSARLQFYQADGDLARPYSEVRFIHDDTHLYVGLYASDENMQSDVDGFDVSIGGLSVRLSVTGKVTPATPDIAVGADPDGTVDNPKDHDEEWKLEVGIPLARIGLAPGKPGDRAAAPPSGGAARAGGAGPIDAHVARCDVTRDGVKHCGDWSGTLTLE